MGQPQVVAGLRQRGWHLSSGQLRQRLRAVDILWRAICPGCPTELFSLAGFRSRLPTISAHRARLENVQPCDGNTARGIRSSVHLVTAVPKTRFLGTLQSRWWGRGGGRVPSGCLPRIPSPRPGRGGGAATTGPEKNPWRAAGPPNLLDCKADRYLVKPCLIANPQSLR